MSPMEVPAAWSNGFLTRLKLKAKLAARVELAFDESQPRDQNGRWTNSPLGAMQGEIKRQEGFTVHPRSGETPKTGFQVSIDNKTMKPTPTLDEFLHGDEEELAGRFESWLVENAEAFSDPDVHIGGWLDSDTSLVHIDPSQWVESESEAVNLGKSRNQISVWDNVNKREIPTGGSGSAG